MKRLQLSARNNCPRCRGTTPDENGNYEFPIEQTMLGNGVEYKLRIVSFRCFECGLSVEFKEGGDTR